MPWDSPASPLSCCGDTGRISPGCARGPSRASAAGRTPHDACRAAGTAAPDPHPACRAGELAPVDAAFRIGRGRSEEHTSELQSLMRISYAVFCSKKKTTYSVHYLTKHTITSKTTF